MEANSRMLLLIVLIHFCLKVTVQSRMVDHPMDYNNVSLTIRMPNVVSHKADSLVCMSKKLDAQESYIVKFTPHASAKTAHHMMVFGCPDVPRDPGESWLCNSRMNDESVCQSSMEEILFAWALDAPEKKLPDGVGLRVGGTTGINYVVVQLHYARAFEGGETDNSGVTLHMTTARPPMQVGYYIFASFGAVPPQQEEVHVEASCEFQLNYTIYPIGYRTQHPSSQYTFPSFVPPSNYQGHPGFGMPSVFPHIPPPPPLFNAHNCEDDNEALYTMLISWYMSGYHTGYYQGMKNSSKATSSASPFVHR